MGRGRDHPPRGEKFPSLVKSDPACANEVLCQIYRIAKNGRDARDQLHPALGRQQGRLASPATSNSHGGCGINESQRIERIVDYLDLRTESGTGRLGDWETGRLGDWETGRLGDWENRNQGSGDRSQKKGC